jgi:hypothetical protein
MGVEGNGTDLGRKLRQIAILVAVLITAALLAGCKKTKVVETGVGYEVKRLNAKAWASTDSSRPKDLLRLDDSSWHSLVGVRMATTDDSGQAQIKGPNCSAVYVYQNSGLVMSACPKGGGTGSCSTGTQVSTNCNVSIRTIPADVETVGTWFSVTHLEELQLTLVIVADGEVKVTPYTRLNYRLVDREQLQYEVTTRDPGDPIEVQAIQGETPRFLYTASDDMLRELQALGELPAPRTPLGLEELPALREVLVRFEPNLDPWLEQILEQAGQDGFEVELQPSVVTLVSLIDGEARPNLAQAWDVSEDGLLWTFRLTEGREMTDGRPYTSEIVEQILTQNEEGFRWIKGYVGSEMIDDYTIMIVLESPNPNFLQEVSRIELP